MSDYPVYFDYAATTPLDERVLAEMLPYFSADFGNPSSVHRYGQRAEAAVETARQRMASLLGCKPAEIVFTSGGTESDNLALRGIVLAARQQTNNSKLPHVLISPVEHHAVSHTAFDLARLGLAEVELLPVDEYGLVDPQAVQARLRPETVLVSIILANNEIGTIHKLDEIGAICKSAGVALHTDAVQAGAYLDLRASIQSADLVSIGAHKFYGPKGVGALIIRDGLKLQPIQSGGAQEQARRAGTSNVPYIAGMAAALDLAQSRHLAEIERLTPLRDHLIGQILESIPDAQLTGHTSQRLPNHASFAFRGVPGNTLLMLLDANGFACSSGSACKTGNPEPSEVLLALGLAPEWAGGSLRLTLGHGTQADHIHQLMAVLPGLVETARRL